MGTGQSLAIPRTSEIIQGQFSGSHALQRPRRQRPRSSTELGEGAAMALIKPNSRLHCRVSPEMDYTGQ